MREQRSEPNGPEDESRKWDAVAEGWRKHRGVFEAAARELDERLLERAAIGEGDVVLDVATGPGDPAIAAARRAGASGRVVATDFSTEMLAQARARAAEAGLTNLEFLERDAQQLDFASGTFDAAPVAGG